MKKNNKSKPSVSYEPEADVLRVEVGAGSIDHASEVGNVVVHFDKRDIPVYLEILEASKFLKKMSSVLKSGIRQEIITRS